MPMKLNLVRVHRAELSINIKSAKYLTSLQLKKQVKPLRNEFK